MFINLFTSVSAALLGYLLWGEIVARRMLGVSVMALTTIHYIALVMFPAVFSSLHGFVYEADIGHSPLELARVYVGDLIFTILFCLGYSATRRHQPRTCTALGRLSLDDRVLLLVLVIGGAGAYVLQFVSPAFSIADATKWADLPTYAGEMSRFLAYSTTVFRWTSLFAGSMALLLSRPWSITWVTSCILMAAQLGYAAVNGLRGGIIYLGCTGLAACLLCRKWRLLIGLAVGSVAITPIFNVLHEDVRYHTFSQRGTVRNIDMIEDSAKIVMDYAFTSGFATIGSVLDSWAVRAQGPRNSIGLYAEYDSGSAAGIKPIFASLFYPIPRTLWPGKPVGGSVDDSRLGSAIFLVQRLKGNMAPEDMGPLLGSAHAYWEGGWLWLCVAGLLTGVFWGKLLSWGENRGGLRRYIVVLSFTAALPIDGFLGAINPIYCYILIAWQIPIPMMVLERLTAKLRSKGDPRRSEQGLLKGRETVAVGRQGVCLSKGKCLSHSQ